MTDANIAQQPIKISADVVPGMARFIRDLVENFARKCWDYEPLQGNGSFLRDLFLKPFNIGRWTTWITFNALAAAHIAGRKYMTPDDVKSVYRNVLLMLVLPPSVTVDVSEREIFHEVITQVLQETIPKC